MNRKIENIGCNAVEPICDEPNAYNVKIYKECLDSIKLHGYRYVEYSHVAHLSSGDAKKIGEYAKKIEVKSRSIHSEHLNSDTNKAIDEYFKIQRKCAENCSLLGAKIMVIHPPNIKRDKKRDIFIISTIAEIAKKKNILVGIENVSPSSMKLIDMVNLIYEMNIGNLGFTLDTGHAGLYGDDPAKAVDLMGEKLWHTHLQDNFGVNDDHCPPGIGILDWKKILNALIKIKYKGVFMLELTGPGVKSRRKIEQLKIFSLEKEMVFGLNYLKFLLMEL